MLAYLNGRVADIRTRLPRAFATLVPGRLIIKRVPPEIEAGAPGGYAGRRVRSTARCPANITSTCATPRNWPRFSLPTLTYHEGIPGPCLAGRIYQPTAADPFAARLQRLFAKAGRSTPSSSPTSSASMTAIRWASSAISSRALPRLPPRRRHRPARHALDPRPGDRVVRRHQRRRPASRVRARSTAIARWPGQACGYKVGHIEIDRLRDKAKAALGAKYDLRRSTTRWCSAEACR